MAFDATDKAFSYITNCIDTLADLRGAGQTLRGVEQLADKLNDLAETLDEVTLDEQDERTEKFILECENLAYEVSNGLSEQLEDAVNAVVRQYEDSADRLAKSVMGITL